MAKVYFGMYGSGIQQECGKNYGISLPVMVPERSEPFSQASETVSPSPLSFSLPESFLSSSSQPSDPSSSSLPMPSSPQQSPPSSPSSSSSLSSSLPLPSTIPFESLPPLSQQSTYTRAWRQTELKLQAGFLRVSSTATPEQRISQSRLTLVPSPAATTEIPIFCARSSAHSIESPYFGNRPLTAAIRAMKCREDMTSLEDCSSSRGDKSIFYVVQAKLKSPSSPAGTKILRFTIGEKNYTSRYNPDVIPKEFIKNVGRWLYEEEGFAFVMAALPSNIKSESEAAQILKNQALPAGPTLPGLFERTHQYYSNLPEATRLALIHFGDLIWTMSED